MHNATNAGHTMQNDGWTMQNDSRTMRNVSRNTLNVCQGPKGGLEEPPRAPGDLPPLPLYLKKLQCQKMIFGTLGTKKIESDN